MIQIDVEMVRSGGSSWLRGWYVQAVPRAGDFLKPPTDNGVLWKVQSVQFSPSISEFDVKHPLVIVVPTTVEERLAMMGAS